MSYDRTYTTLGEKIITVVGGLLFGITLFLVMVAYQITV